MSSEMTYAQEGDRCKVELRESGEPVARLTIVDRESRLGQAWVRMGGIASVRTSPKHRGKGHGRRLMEETVKYMAAEGYLVSLLFGIPAFYHRFGYATVLPRKSEVRVKTEAAETLQQDLPVREAGESDLAALVDVYHAANCRRQGIVKRGKDAFRAWPDDPDDWFQEQRRILVVEKDGAVIGYAAAEHGWRMVSEWGVEPYELAAAGPQRVPAAASLLRVLAGEAAARRREWLALEMPADSSLAALLRQIGYRQEVEYSHDQGGMGRITNLAGVAAALVATLRERNLALPPSDRPGKVVFACEDEHASVQLDDGPEVTVRLPQHALLQLLLGYRGIQELRLAYPACVAEDDVATVAALFPAGNPYMWQSDHF